MDVLKINLFIEGKMQRNITEKLKISKSQKNNSIKLLAATIALSAGLTAMDEAAAILDDELGVKKPLAEKLKGDDKEKKVKFLKDKDEDEDESIEDSTVKNEKPDYVQTLTSEKEEIGDAPFGRGGADPKANEIVKEILKEGEDKVAPNAAPTVANVVVGLGVYLWQSVGAAIDYATPNFVKSIYNNGKSFFTSLREIRRFFRTKK
ncbi:MAG: hypothetical protein NT128_07070 [Proteobacteria bacterium]|nr:hypothetical protein [Pseudomonadota bacterium]